MIVQALVGYYDRLAANPTSGVAPIGWVDKPIGWLVRLDAEGKPKALESTYETEGKKRVAHVFRVPEGEHKQGINPRLLWDNAEYVLGVSKEGAKNPGKAAEKAAAFRERIATLGLESLRPVEAFLAHAPAEALRALDVERYDALMADVGALISFRLAGDIGPVCDREDVKAAYERVRAEVSAEARRCIITGKKGPITQTSTAVQIRNGISSGCRLIAFQKGSGFDSYGKEQGDNAPIGEEVTFKYTTALKRLLAKGSTNQFSVGNETLLFWASAEGAMLEAALPLLLTADDPDAGTRSLQALYEAVEEGKFPSADMSKRFYILGLQPNAARIAVRLWVEQTVAEATLHVVQYFKDFQIVGRDEKAPLPLYFILKELSPLGKVENLPPRLGGELLYAAFRGTRFPDSLAQSVLRRLKTEDVTPLRAALLKAWLIRYETTERKPTVMLDLENDNPGYCLGRLFAVLEKAQEEALGDVNASIKDRFYAAASANPAAVFATLLRNNTFHVKKLIEKRQKSFEIQKQEIFAHLSDIPEHLDLVDQVRFALGYYHQRKDLFTKKSTSPESANEPTQDTFNLE